MTEQRRGDRRKRTRIALFAILALVVLSAGWLGWRLYRIWGAAHELRADAHQWMALLEGGAQEVDPQQAISLLRSTQDDLQALEAASRPFLPFASLAGWVPRYGPTIEAAPVLLDMALDLTTAGETVIDALAPLLDDEGGGSQDDGSFVSELTVALDEARPALEQALAAVREAQAARDQLDVEALDPRLGGWISRLDRYLPLMEQGLQGALVAPELLGAGEPRTYLLLVQNEDELRATGGLISGVAQMSVDAGRIETLAFEDSYAVDDFSHPYPEPPTPLREIMLADLWVFRDSNWSPDFPTSARKAIELFNVSRDAEIDGVLALDQRAISLLLGPLGPLEVEGSSEPVTSQNVLQVARRAWAPGEEPEADWWRHRKDIMGSVLEGAMRRLKTGLDREQVVGLGYAAVKALRERHLLLYVEDEKAATVLRDLRWDGALVHTGWDYLMVVDSNVGFNKVNARVEESVDYAVDLGDPMQPRATLTVHHRHPVKDWSDRCSQTPRYSSTYAGMTKRCYYDYLRICVPAQSELRGATPHPIRADILLSGQRQSGRVSVSSTDTGKTVFATFFVLQPESRVSTTFTYALPPGILERVDGAWRYRLTVQKQSGTDKRPTTVTLRLPAGAEIVTAEPGPAQCDGRLLVYRAELDTDFELDVTWRTADTD
ncbi:MAG: DUF4012 domain-containing protein [Anaerolineae bacterium]|jgi:hypothetical protein